MIAWLKRLFYDEATFEQYFRTALVAFATAYEMGILPQFAESSAMWYVAKGLFVLAMAMRAGEKNPKAGE